MIMMIPTGKAVTERPDCFPYSAYNQPGLLRESRPEQQRLITAVATRTVKARRSRFCRTRGRIRHTLIRIPAIGIVSFADAWSMGSALSEQVEKRLAAGDGAGEAVFSKAKTKRDAQGVVDRMPRSWGRTGLSLT